MDTQWLNLKYLAGSSTVVSKNRSSLETVNYCLVTIQGLSLPPQSHDSTQCWELATLPALGKGRGEAQAPPYPEVQSISLQCSRQIRWRADRRWILVARGRGWIMWISYLHEQSTGSKRQALTLAFHYTQKSSQWKNSHLYSISSKNISDFMAVIIYSYTTLIARSKQRKSCC